LTGNLSSIVNYDNPNNDGAIKATYFSNVEYSGRIASTNGDADTPFEIGDTFSEKPSNSFRFGSNVNESDTILVDVFFVDQLFRLDDGVFFGYDYTDFFSIDIDNIDAGSIDISMTNDLGSTAVTTASVYDLNGNLMPFLRPYSETFGFEFAPIEGVVVPPTPAPAPATAWLFGAALLGLGAARRRRA
jgi:MYXO-CTERM domain-containing protein